MDTIDEVLRFVEKNPDYRAQIGVIKLGDREHTYLTWAALPRNEGDPWIPAMRSIQKLNPSAFWVPLTAEELQDYLSRGPEPALAEPACSRSRRA